MKITAVDDAPGDFMTGDIGKLMDEKPPEVKGPTVDDIFDAYDRELLSFDHDAGQVQTWPQGIRKRRCTK